jgi:hypothetical protein
MNTAPDHAVSIELECPLKFQGSTIQSADVIRAVAYSWPHSGTLQSVYLDGREVLDPYLYPFVSLMDEAIAMLLWSEARACSDVLMDKFYEEQDGRREAAREQAQACREAAE